VAEELTNPEANVETPRRGPSRKYPWAILVVLVLFVIVPFISWYGTWFGRPLSDSALAEYLHDREKPRKVQHALTQLEARIEKSDPAVKRWYPDIIAAASNDSAEVRLTSAWVMGQDNTSDEFHTALLTLINDPVAAVRHNAALALVRFGDGRSRPELAAMLRSTSIKSDSAGKIQLLVREEGIAVGAHGPLARIKQGNGETHEIRAEEAGRVETILVADGAQVEEGQDLMAMLPSAEQVREALRALYVIGQREDIPHIQRYTRPLTGMPDWVPGQAQATIDAIRARTPGQ